MAAKNTSSRSPQTSLMSLPLSSLSSQNYNATENSPPRSSLESPLSSRSLSLQPQKYLPTAAQAHLSKISLLSQQWKSTRKISSLSENISSLVSSHNPPLQTASQLSLFLSQISLSHRFLIRLPSRNPSSATSSLQSFLPKTPKQKLPLSKDLCRPLSKKPHCPYLFSLPDLPLQQSLQQLPPPGDAPPLTDSERPLHILQQVSPLDCSSKSTI